MLKSQRKSQPKRNHSQRSVRHREKDDFIGGVILILIGLLLLAGNVYGLNVWSLLATYWPVILIIVGIGIIIGHWRDY